VRRPLFVTIVGLALAFGAFYWLGWPSSLKGSTGNKIGFNDVAAGELLYAGLNFDVIGRREIYVTTVKLEGATSEVNLVDVRLSVAGSSDFAPVGALREPQPDVDALPRAAGATLRPGQSGFFVVVFRADALGRFSFRGLNVKYRSGWLTRSAMLMPRVEADVTVSPTPTPTPA
jgi:uncharacterized protein (DUF58 family)